MIGLGFFKFSKEMNNQNSQQNEGAKLNAIANIIEASSGAIGTVGGLFGKGPQPEQHIIIQEQKQEENKKKQNQLLLYGGLALAFIVILLMLKKK